MTHCCISKKRTLKRFEEAKDKEDKIVNGLIGSVLCNGVDTLTHRMGNDQICYRRFNDVASITLLNQSNEYFEKLVCWTSDKDTINLIIKDFNTAHSEWTQITKYEYPVANYYCRVFFPPDIKVDDFLAIVKTYLIGQNINPPEPSKCDIDVDKFVQKYSHMKFTDSPKFGASWLCCCANPKNKILSLDSLTNKDVIAELDNHHKKQENYEHLCYQKMQDRMCRFPFPDNKFCNFVFYDISDISDASEDNYALESDQDDTWHYDDGEWDKLWE